MDYNGKKVWTEDNFDYRTVHAGAYVSQEVVDNAMNCLPPVSMSSQCSQMGEPYAHVEDPDTGRWRAIYATFRKVYGEWPDGIWEYCGHCFRGETIDRSWNHCGSGSLGSTKNSNDHIECDVFVRADRGGYYGQ